MAGCRGPRPAAITWLMVWSGVAVWGLWHAPLHSGILPVAAYDFYREINMGRSGIANCTQIKVPVIFKAEVKNRQPFVSVIGLKCSPQARVTPKDPAKQACSTELCLGTVPLALGHGLLPQGVTPAITATGSPTSDEGMRWVFDMSRFAVVGDQMEDFMETSFYFRCDNEPGQKNHPPIVPCILEIEVDISAGASIYAASGRYLAYAVALVLVTLAAFF